MKQLKETLDFYNQNAREFVQGTQAVDFKATQDRFLSYLKSGARVLDYGCGSGRDTKYFIQKGFAVDPVDGSEEICRLASEYTGIRVRKLLFNELNVVEAYDAIWACASILHVSKVDLPDIFTRMINSLHENGIIYTSFKYGDFEGEKNGRYFTCFDEKSFDCFAREFPELVIQEQWVTGDVREDRKEEKWLNIIMRKSTAY